MFNITKDFSALKALWALVFLLSYGVISSDLASAQAARKSKAHRSQKTVARAHPSHQATEIKGTIAKIEISGLKKIESDAVRAKLKTKPGDPYSSEAVRADVQSIFDMGYFYNVEVDRTVGPQGINLNYILTEKPSIVEIVYRGNEKIEKDDLVEAAGIKAYTILDLNKVREAVDKMNKLYEDKGFFLARIQSRIEEVKKGEEVRLIFDVKENDKVKVKKITFLGNHALTDTRLKSVMQTQEGGFFSWLSGSGAYKQEAFDRDVSVLNYLYFNEGYIQVKIDRPQVYVTPDKKSVYITFHVDEGEQFSVGKVDYSGDLLFSKEELAEATEIQKANIFVYETLQKDLKTLQYKYGDLGYAFVNVIPRTTVREKERLVDINFEIEKGQKVYFGDIIVTGNTKTRDKVVRRELRVREGELYNETRKQKSIENVKRLGYFSDVVFNTSTDPDQPTVLNVDIQVKERSTGTIQVGAGYSTVGGFLFQGQVTQTNLFGRGQTIGISVEINQVASTYNLGFTEPYFFDTEWSVGFDAYKTRRQLSAYEENKVGGDVRLGHPLGLEYLMGYLTYKLENTNINLARPEDEVIYPTATANGVTSSVTGSLVYDRRNDRWIPTNGYYGSISLEQAGVGGDKVYTKGFSTGRFYKPVFWGLTWRNNLTYGFITAPQDRQPPFNELFLLGGPNSLRGFSWFTVGTRRLAPPPATGGPAVLVPYGGKQELFYQSEIEFPLISEAQIKGVLFYDIGNAEDVIVLKELRNDVGFGFRWFSPIGPLRFEWGFPLDRKAELGEQFSNFEFSIGSPF